MNSKILRLESSQLFMKQSEKSQVLTPGVFRGEIYRTRQSHVYEVRTIGSMIAKNIFKNSIDLDFLESLELVCLTHDIGHSAFGHAGQKVLDRKMKKVGLREGFSDNNNNLKMLEYNDIPLSNYELASLIKYPEKLYPDQKHYQVLLCQEIENDKKKFNIPFLKRTLACEIMDHADEIAYTMSDFYDMYALNSVKKSELLKFLRKILVKSENKEEFEKMIDSVLNNDKRSFRHSVFEVKMYLIESSSLNKKTGEIFFKSNSIKDILSMLKKFVFKNFIHTEDLGAEREMFLLKYKKLIDKTLKDPENMIESKLYLSKYLKADTNLEQFRVIRDYLSDMTDQYVINK